MVNYFLESSVCLIIFYVAFLLLFRNDPFFTRNRFYLILSIICSLVIPILNFGTVESIEPVADLGFLPLPNFEVIPTDHLVSSSYSFSNVYMITYFLGVTLFCSYFLLRIILIMKWFRKFDTKKINGTKVYLTKGAIPTASFFNKIFWNDNRQYSDGELKAIMGHELTHIKEWHSLDLLFVEVIQIFLWFNPIVYFYKRSLKQQHEFRADAEATNYLSDEIYKRLMFHEFLKQMELSLTHYFGNSFLKKRIIMLNYKSKNKMKQLKLLYVLPIFLILVVTYSCDNDTSLNEGPVTETIDDFKVIKEIIRENGSIFLQGKVESATGEKVAKIPMLLKGTQKPVFFKTDESGAFKVELKEEKNLSDLSIKVFSSSVTKQDPGKPESKMTIKYEKITENGQQFISGTIQSTDGKSLPGVNVILKGKPVGTATDVEGKFILKTGDEAGSLVFSFIGFITEEISF